MFQLEMLIYKLTIKYLIMFLFTPMFSTDSPKSSYAQATYQCAIIDPEQVKHLLQYYRSKLNQANRDSQSYHKSLQELQETASDFHDQSNTNELQFWKRKAAFLQEQLSTYQENVLSVFPKIKHYLQFQQHHREQSALLKEQLQQNRITITNLREEIDYIKQKSKKDLRFAQGVLAQNQLLKLRIAQIQLQNHQSKKIIETQNSQSNVSNEEYLNELHENNDNLNKMLILSKKQKSEIQQSATTLNEKNHQLQEENQKLKGKVQYISRKRDELLEEISANEKVIHELCEQIQSLKDVLRNPFERIERENPQINILRKRRQSDESEFEKELNKIKSKEDVIKLSDDIGDYNGDIQLSFNRSIMGKNSEFGDEKENVRNADLWDESFIQPKYQKQMEIEMADIKNSNSSNNKFDSSGQNDALKSSKEIPLKNTASQEKVEKVEPSKSFFGMRRLTSFDSSSILNLSVFQKKKSIVPEKKVQPVKNPYKVTPITIDPYYSHFVLTSQSIKMRQNNQKMLTIDVKPLYDQIVQKMVPMHQWEQWLKNKLRKIVKQQQKKEYQMSKKTKSSRFT